MKVEGRIFLPPGNGTCYEKQLSMLDAHIPANADTALSRSYGAIKHFWPTVSVHHRLTKATSIEITHDLNRNVDCVTVKGEWPVSKRRWDNPTEGPLEWEVVWRTDARVHDDSRLLESLMNLGQKELSILAANRTPTKQPVVPMKEAA